MTVANILLCPAYYLETKVFNPINQPKNQLVKEIAARIVALAAPLLYSYQICLHGAVSLIDLVLSISGIMPGVILQTSIPSFCYSIRNFFSSICELPQKILFGPHCPANYFGDGNRYKRIDDLSTIRTDLI